MTENKKTETKKPLIYGKILAIMADVKTIGKERKNVAQGYAFRGIDDIYNELHSLFTKHKVFTVPTVLDAHHEERKSKSGGALIYRIYTIKYTFYAEDGSFVEAVVMGEGMDSGDKAGNKALSVAHKYVLLQTLLIPTDDPKDSEDESHQVNSRPRKEEKRSTEEPPSIEDMANGEPEDEQEAFRNITITLRDGSLKKVTKFEALNYFARLKDVVGADVYYEVLDADGYSKSNKIPPKDIPKVYAKMIEAYAAYKKL